MLLVSHRTLFLLVSRSTTPKGQTFYFYFYCRFIWIGASSTPSAIAAFFNRFIAATPVSCFVVGGWLSGFMYFYCASLRVPSRHSNSLNCCVEAATVESHGRQQERKKQIIHRLENTFFSCCCCGGGGCCRLSSFTLSIPHCHYRVGVVAAAAAAAPSGELFIERKKKKVEVKEKGFNIRSWRSEEVDEKGFSFLLLFGKSILLLSTEAADAFFQFLCRRQGLLTAALSYYFFYYYYCYYYLRIL